MPCIGVRSAGQGQGVLLIPLRQVATAASEGTVIGLQEIAPGLRILAGSDRVQLKCCDFLAQYDVTEIAMIAVAINRTTNGPPFESVRAKARATLTQAAMIAYMPVLCWFTCSPSRSSAGCSSAHSAHSATANGPANGGASGPSCSSSGPGHDAADGSPGSATCDVPGPSTPAGAECALPASAHGCSRHRIIGCPRLGIPLQDVDCHNAVFFRALQGDGLAILVLLLRGKRLLGTVLGDHSRAILGRLVALGKTERHVGVINLLDVPLNLCHVGLARLLCLRGRCFGRH